MRPDRDPDRERADLFSDVLGDDPTLRRVVSDLDTLYNERRQPPARLLLPQEWATATMRQAADQCERDPARPAAELPNASRRSMRGAPMFTRERSIRPRRIQVFAATAAALLIVGLLSFLLMRGTSGTRQPVGSSNADGDLLQKYAQQGGVNVVLNYSCPPDAGQCNAEALLPQLEAALNKRLAATSGVTATFFQPRQPGTLDVKVLGVKDDQRIVALLGFIGQMNIIDTGSQQVPVGQTVAVCPSSVQNCPAGSYHVVFRGQQLDPHSVSAQLDPQTKQPIVSFTFAGAARTAFATYTRNHIGEYLTITVDNAVIESAVIQSEIDGQAQIFGLSTLSDAQNLVAELKDGPLPLDTVVEGYQAERPVACVPTSTSTSPIGVPAITPHIAHPASGQPTYTVSDVRAYVEAHLPGTHASILQIYQLTALQAAVLEDGECTGLSDNAPVFVVTLTGDFSPVQGPPVSATAGVKPASQALNYAAEVFDGTTGNLIDTMNLPKEEASSSPQIHRT